MPRRLGGLVVGVALVGVLLIGCGTPTEAEGTGSAAAQQTTEGDGTGAGAGRAGNGKGDGGAGKGDLSTTAPDGYAVTLTSAGRTSRVDVAMIEGLPQTTIDTPQAGQATQTGARVSEVLKTVGVTTFDTLVVTGPKGQQSFSAEEIDDTVILGVSRRQTLRFSGENIPQDRWVQDVTGIDAS